MRALLLVSIACVLLLACADDDTGVRDAGAGAGGAGDGGGSGGSGGSAGMDSGMDSGTDATFDADVVPMTCDDDAGTTSAPSPSWYAQKTTLDVWWQGQPMRDPGRDAIEVITLNRIEAIGGGDDVAATIKICGLTFPPYTSDVRCEAHQMTIDDAIWDRPNMPRFSIPSLAENDTVAALVGIDLPGLQGLAAWPTAAMTYSVECEAGTGLACYPDQDGDNVAGITARYRLDHAPYIGPYDTGECTAPRPYIFAGPPTGFYCLAGSCPSNALVAAEQHLGLRLPLRVGDGCDATSSMGVELRSPSCVIDPSGLILDDPFEDRDETMNYTCRDHESAFTDDTLPQYRVLAAGEVPGDTTPPNGWTQSGRDIDRRMSEGMRTVSVRLGSLTDPAPTCTQVRAAFAND